MIVGFGDESVAEYFGVRAARAVGLVRCALHGGYFSGQEGRDCGLRRLTSSLGLGDVPLDEWERLLAELCQADETLMKSVRRMLHADEDVDLGVADRGLLDLGRVPGR